MKEVMMVDLLKAWYALQEIKEFLRNAPVPPDEVANVIMKIIVEWE